MPTTRRAIPVTPISRARLPSPRRPRFPLRLADWLHRRSPPPRSICRWSYSSTNETGFNVQRAVSASGPFTQIASLGAGVTTYQNTGLSSATTYYYQVYAYNSAGNSGYSNIASAATLAPAPTIPASPGGLAASAVSTTQINLQWSDNSSNETGFDVQRAASASGPFTQIASVGAGVATYQDTGLSSATTYYYQVYAYNSAGNSGYSNIASAATLAPAPTIPASPSGLAASAVSATQINLQWSYNSSNETGLDVQRAASASGPFTQIASVGAGVATYQDTGLSSATTYYYQVYAYNSAGNSGYSNTASAATLAPATTTPSPVAPTSLGATAVSSSEIDLHWTDNSSGQCGFYLQRSTSILTGYVQIAALGAGVTTYQDKGMSPSTRYFYEVCAYNSTGSSLYAGPSSATTPAYVSPAPTNLTATAISPVQIAVQWTYNCPGVVGFEVTRTNPNSTISEFGLSASTTSFVDRTVQPGTTYQYSVYAAGASGNSQYSATVTCTTMPNVALDSVGQVPAIGDGIAISGHYAYQASSVGLQVLDISDPANPLLKASLPMDAWAVAADSAGNLYVTDGKTLKLYNVSNAYASNPQFIASLSLPDYANSMCVANGMVYVACCYAGLVAADASLTGLYSPGIMGPSPDQAWEVAVLGNTAVVADGNGGIRVFDVSNPIAPAFLTAISTPDTAYGVKVSTAPSGSSYAYVAATTAGLLVVDISTPSQASIVGTGASRDWAMGIALFGQYACVANAGGVHGLPANGLQVFSLAQPTQPLETLFVETPGTLCYSVTVSGDLAFVSQYNAPLSIYQLSYGD